MQGGRAGPGRNRAGPNQSFARAFLLPPDASPGRAAPGCARAAQGVRCEGFGARVQACGMGGAAGPGVVKVTDSKMLLSLHYSSAWEERLGRTP